MLGFSFPLSSFVADDLEIDGNSIRNIVIRAPSDVSERFLQIFNSKPRVQMTQMHLLVLFQSVSVESSSGSGTLAGLSEDSQDDIILYGAIGGGVILFFILVGIITRSSKEVFEFDEEKAESAIEIDDQEEVDEFDDLFDDN